MKKISDFEKNLITYLCNNIWIVIVAVSFTISLLTRWLLLGFVSGDATDSLIPWYEQIKSYGGFEALRYQVGNYNILYQTIIAFFTYLPFDGLSLIKAFSGTFDILLGMLCGYIVFEFFGKSKTVAALVFGFIINCPTVMLDSAVWGQCDSIYTFWGLLAVCFLIKERFSLSFLFLGVAFAFKLQAVFFIPFFVFYYIYKKNYSLLHFVEVPVVMLISSLPGAFFGRNIVKDTFGIYLGQTSFYRKTLLSYASFWGTLTRNNSEEWFTYFKRFGLMLTIIILMIVCVRMLRYKIDNAGDYFILLFMFLFTSVYFLPSMHDRYDYAYVILAMILVAYHRKFFLLAAGIIYVSLNSWSMFLFEHLSLQFEWVIFINFVCYFAGMYFIFRYFDNNHDGNESLHI